MQWLYTHVGGIRRDTGALAYKQSIIRPEPVGDLNMARVSFESPYGRIRSEWSKGAEGRFELLAEIPANTTSTACGEGCWSRIPRLQRGLQGLRCRIGNLSFRRASALTEGFFIEKVTVCKLHTVTFFGRCRRDEDRVDGGVMSVCSAGYSVGFDQPLPIGYHVAHVISSIGRTECSLRISRTIFVRLSFCICFCFKVVRKCKIDEMVRATDDES